MATSASASPGPSSSTPGPNFLSEHNQHDLPKPFKKVAQYSTSSSGRKRNYKQIIAMEQEAAFELGTVGATSSRNRKKKGGGKKGGGGEVYIAPDGTKLQGAAAKAAKKREARLKKEAAAALEAESEDATPAPGTEGGDETTATVAAADETMASVDPDVTTKTEIDEEAEAQQKAEEAERQRKMNLPTYLSVEAPPSLRPAKKYCDVTGLLAPYTDPKTGLRYHSAEIYDVIKTFGPGVDQAYLALRGRNNTLM